MRPAFDGMPVELPCNAGIPPPEDASLCVLSPGDIFLCFDLGGTLPAFDGLIQSLSQRAAVGAVAAGT